MDTQQADLLPDLETLAAFPAYPERTPPTPPQWQHTPPGHREAGPTGYGIPTGRQYGLLVVDLDRKGGKDGVAAWEALEATHGKVETFTVETPSGGYHLYFRVFEDSPEIRNSAGALAPGIDIRADGGFVYGPGTVRSDGVYTVADESPMIPPPAWLLEALRSPAPTAPAGPTTGSQALALPELEAALRGSRSPYAPFWRDVAKGEEPIKDRAPAGWNDYLTRATQWLAGRIPDATGDSLVALMGPSLSLMADRRRAEGKDLEGLTAPAVASMFDRAAQTVRSERAAARVLRDALNRAEEEAARHPRILQFRRSFYLLHPPDPEKGTYVGPFVKDEVWAQATARETFPTTAPTKNGTRRLTVDDMVESFGAPLDGVIQDLAATESSLAEGPSGGMILTVPAFASTPPAPEYHPAIHAWLEALGGDVLLDWIRVVRELREAVPALWISGAAGTGKSLLARGLAGLWGRTPIPLGAALSRFNDVLTDCPIVFGDEELPSKGPYTDFEGFKRLVADTRRMIEPKGLPQVELRGAVRVVIAMNNFSSIRGSKDLTAEDVGAICDRVIHIRRDGEDAEIIAAYLARQEVQREWIDGGALARHLEWIVQNHPAPPPGPRFRIPASENGLGAALDTTSGGASSYVCRVIAQWLLRMAKTEDPPPTAGVFYRPGLVAVQAKWAVAQIKGTEGRRFESQIGRTLKRLARGKSERDHWLVPVTRLAQWAEGDGWVSADSLHTAASVLDGRG